MRRFANIATYFQFKESIYRPLVPLAGLRSRRKDRQDIVFLSNRNERFDKPISPAGILGDGYVGKFMF